MLEPNTIYRGDCLEVLNEMPDECADMVLTDPPYGINYHSHMTDNHDYIKNDQGIEHAKFVAEYMRQVKRILKPDGVAVIYNSGGGAKLAPWEAIINMDKWLKVRNVIVWKKYIGLGWRYRPEYETCVLCAKQDQYRWYGRSNQGNVICCPQVIPREDDHPTPKPVSLHMQFIKNHTMPGDLVVDPFAGHASVGVACARLGRRYIGIEIDEAYFVAAQHIYKEACSNKKLDRWF